MNKVDRKAILEEAAKTIALRLFDAASYCRTRARVDIKEFDRELRSAIQRWRTVHHNLNPKKGDVP